MSARNSTGVRVPTGVPGLDSLLGGGLIPGTLTVVAGASGIGKTQLALQFAHAGQAGEGRPGALVDLTSRGDSQNHADYAERMFGWKLAEALPATWTAGAQVFDPTWDPGNLLRVFGVSGRRVSRQDLEPDEWRLWQAELQQKLTQTIAFMYGNFSRGARRCVVDGVEPAQKAAESAQIQLFDYIYHQIIRKDHDWVARDLFRQDFRSLSAQVEARGYDCKQLTCLLMYTTRETMLQDLLTRPLDEGDCLANANTILLLGKIQQGDRMGRGLQIAKHRGSACDERIVPFQITENGLQLTL